MPDRNPAIVALRGLKPATSRAAATEAECDRAFGSNIGEGKHSETEEDTKSQQRQDEADCHRTD